MHSAGQEHAVNEPAAAQPKVGLAQSSSAVGTFRERDGAQLPIAE
jgi:hypothetical protein